MNPNVFPSIQALIAQGVSKDKIAGLLRDIWQLQMDTRMFMITHNILVDPNFDIAFHLEQMEEYINNFHIHWKRYVEQFSLPKSYKRTYKLMEGIFQINLDDMETLYNPQERLSFYVNIQGKYLCSIYSYNRSMLKSNITLMTRENLINSYRQIRQDFLMKINQLQVYRNIHWNEFPMESREQLMSLDILFEETLNDEDDEEIMNYIS